jgi:methyl-galactoside transport system substrate-binding protein
MRDIGKEIFLMKIKKITAFAIAATMLFSLTACGSDNSVSSEVETSSDTEELNVGLFYYTYSDTYTSDVRAALDQTLSEAGITYQDYDANTSQFTQNEQIDTAISQGTNLLLVDMVSEGSADAANEIIAKAKAADIPIIFFDRDLAQDGNEEEVLNNYDSSVFVGAETSKIGQVQGSMIGHYLLNNWNAVDKNGDGQISYAMFKGQEGNIDADSRTKYSVEAANAVLAGAGRPRLVYFDTTSNDCYQADISDGWSSEAAEGYMAQNLAQYNEAHNNMIELVICNNDSMAEGVISALNEAGYNLGDDGNTIPVFGVGATKEAKELIATGKMTGTIIQDAEDMAACLMQLVTNVGDGKEILDGTEDYRVDSEITNMIYIPYDEYTGERN